ncbi:2Fe-2S iron-sulfur cluster-binding protein [Sphaerimonospora cavernae]|uniref:2Fe-2S iron-sulfur cluster-binding protein n=1 Tax=Sphaerimonospora cavernae TaxID=1740611 RepID=A0ABV6UCW9_9ACTN
MSLTTSVRPRARLRFHPLTVAAVEPLAADGSAVAVTFRVPDALRAEFAFAPGQHVTVRASVDGSAVRRSYSLCSSPEELERGGTLRIGIRAVPGGVFSAYACGALTAGDTLDVLPPVGSFGTRFDPSRSRRYGAIAAGSGITPVLSLARAALSIERASTFTLLYGNRTVESTMFAEELADLKDRHPRRLHLLYAFSRENPRLGLAGGRLDRATLADVLARVLAPAPMDEWFLCGPAGLVRDSRLALVAHGVADSAVRVELFGAGDGDPGERVSLGGGPSPVPEGEARRLRVLLDGRTTVVRVRDDRTILDAALTVRPELPYSCRNGVCGTCRARVVDGQVSMSGGWALSAEELASGYVLTCRSVPAGECVTVDFDAL